jgi:hypothetical protein
MLVHFKGVSILNEMRFLQDNIYLAKYISLLYQQYEYKINLIYFLEYAIQIAIISAKGKSMIVFVNIVYIYINYSTLRP